MTTARHWLMFRAGAKNGQHRYPNGAELANAEPRANSTAL